MFEKFASNVLKDLLDEINLKKTVAKDERKIQLEKLGSDISEIILELEAGKL
jgi:hypothetical protein